MSGFVKASTVSSERTSSRHERVLPLSFSPEHDSFFFWTCQLSASLLPEKVALLELARACNAQGCLMTTEYCIGDSARIEKTIRSVAKTLGTTLSNLKLISVHESKTGIPSGVVKDVVEFCILSKLLAGEYCVLRNRLVRSFDPSNQFHVGLEFSVVPSLPNDQSSVVVVVQETTVFRGANMGHGAVYPEETRYALPNCNPVVVLDIAETLSADEPLGGKQAMARYWKTRYGYGFQSEPKLFAKVRFPGPSGAVLTYPIDCLLKNAIVEDDKKRTTTEKLQKLATDRLMNDICTALRCSAFASSREE